MLVTDDDAHVLGLPHGLHRRRRRARSAPPACIGALALDDHGDGVLPHERTLPKAKTDRLELLRATRANLDPIWGLSLAAGLSALLDPSTASRSPTAIDDDGVPPLAVAHRRPRRVAAIAAAVAGGAGRARRRPPPLRDRAHLPRRRRAAGDRRPRRRRDHDPVVELAPDQLCVRAIHRLLTGLGSAARPARRRSAARSTCTPPGPTCPRASPRSRWRCATAGGLGLVDARRPRAARARPPRSTLALAELPVELRDVDSARFDAGVLPGGARRRRSPTATTRATVAAAGRQGRRRRRGAAAPGDRRAPSAPRPPPASACRRRRRSSRPSRAPAWCSAAST